MKTRIFLVTIWAMILGVFTCTISLRLLLYHHVIDFVFNPNVDFSDFFNFTDIKHFHHYIIVVKIGHLIGFAIFDVLLFNLIRKKNPALVLAILFAILTEIFQLYFNRDGRLYDVIIDSFGVLISYLFIKFNKQSID